jgi:hypothetical protein
MKYPRIEVGQNKTNSMVESVFTIFFLPQNEAFASLTHEPLHEESK